MNYCVYLHTNKINGKKYIGITHLKPERRWSKGEGYRTSRHFYFAIQKYGWDGFTHEVIKSNLTKEQACEMEKNLIGQLKTTDDNFGYNLSTGGESGAAGTKQPQERIEKTRKIHTGRKITEETRIKMSESAKGRKFSKETLEKMSKAKKGKPLSKEHIEHMANAKRGVCMSDSAKENMRKSKKEFMVKVYCETNGKEYCSVHEAARSLGVSASNISSVCKGKHAHTKGYVFRYADDSKEYKSPFGG